MKDILLTIGTNPERNEITIDLAGKQIIKLTPDDARDIIKLLQLGLGQLSKADGEKPVKGAA